MKLPQETSELRIAAHSVSKTFSSIVRGGVPTFAVRDVSLRVHAGELVSVVGPSGSGKSTLLYCIAGLERATSGQVILMRHDISRSSPDAVARVHRGRVGFVFQSLNLVTSLSAIDNVLLPARLARLGEWRGRVARERADALLDSLGVVQGARQRPASLLSGGERQRVAVARVLFTAPKLIFADEPTGSLDSKSGQLVLDALDGLTRHGTSVVLVTHDLDAACRASRTLVMQDGAVVAHVKEPTPASLLDIMNEPRPSMPRADFTDECQNQS